MGKHMRSTLLLVAAAALCLGGCATKRYGRAVEPSTVELSAYSCRDLDLEIVKVRAFQDQIAAGAKIDVMSVLGFLGDFGIGNSMERADAEKSALRRLQQLQNAKAMKSCPASSL
jgi:hypothetical protein